MDIRPAPRSRPSSRSWRRSCPTADVVRLKGVTKGDPNDALGGLIGIVRSAISPGMMEHGREARIAHVKTKPFARFASREGIADEALCDAVARAARGLVDADLGGGVIKQRVAQRGQCRSCEFRTI